MVLLELENSWTVQGATRELGTKLSNGMDVWLVFFRGERLKEGGNQVPLVSKAPETHK